jgi:thioredoxin reductase (NADPH)
LHRYRPVYLYEEIVMSIAENYDVVILGTGPAGLQAAIHAARKKVAVLVVGKPDKSSAYKAHIENLCCVFSISGEEMLRSGREQAAGFGAEFLEEDVLGISSGEDSISLFTEGGKTIAARALVLATGTARNRLGVPGEKELLGRGVSYCVECDGNFFRNEDVAVIGNESAAADGALTLLKSARSVHLISDDLQVSDVLRTELEKSAADIHAGARVERIEGTSRVEAVRLKDGTRIPVSGVFIELGAKGVMELALSLGVQLDEEMKYIQADKQQETSVAGIYAAGDICGPPWQVAKAVGEGCVAGINAAARAKKIARGGE